MLLKHFSSANAMRIKKYGYLIFLVPMCIPAMSYFMGQSDWVQAGGYSTLVAAFGFFLVLAGGPILDIIVGKDPVNPEPDNEQMLSGQMYYKALTLACLPLLAICIFSSAYMLLQWEELSLLGQILFALSTGLVGGIVGINVSHELIHKNTQLEKVSGGLMLSLVCYAGFKVEHIYGHHIHVSTPQDASSARLGQSLYQFLPRAYKENFLNAWKLQKTRLAKKGQSAFSVHNELIWYYSFSVLVSLLMGAFFEFFGGSFLMGVAFFYLQSFMAFTLLEIINYIEHYGLHRNKNEKGKYERVNILHSWNSNFLLTNMFLFQLQRHSDHHAFAARRYQVLRHHEESPQLPLGYAGMIVIALIPPLWKAIMNPKVKAYYKDEPTATNELQLNEKASMG